MVYTCDLSLTLFLNTIYSRYLIDCCSTILLHCIIFLHLHNAHTEAKFFRETTASPVDGVRIDSVSSNSQLNQLVSTLSFFGKSKKIEVPPFTYVNLHSRTEQALGRLEYKFSLAFKISNQVLYFLFTYVYCFSLHCC